MNGHLAGWGIVFYLIASGLIPDIPQPGSDREQRARIWSEVMASSQISTMTLGGHPPEHWPILGLCWVPGHQPQTLRSSPAFKDSPTQLYLLTSSLWSRRLKGGAAKPPVSGLGLELRLKGQWLGAVSYEISRDIVSWTRFTSINRMRKETPNVKLQVGNVCEGGGRS